MLILTRTPGQIIHIEVPLGNGQKRTLRVTLIESRHSRAKIGIEAARDVIITRDELLSPPSGAEHTGQGLAHLTPTQGALE